MTKEECPNCPGRDDHDAEHCPIKPSKNDVRALLERIDEYLTEKGVPYSGKLRV